MIVPATDTMVLNQELVRKNATLGVPSLVHSSCKRSTTSLKSSQLSNNQGQVEIFQNLTIIELLSKYIISISISCARGLVNVAVKTL